MNAIDLQNISDFLKSAGWNFTANELRIRKGFFSACELLILAQRMIESSDVGPNDLSDEIAAFLKESGGYQTWNPPEWIWKKEWEEGKSYIAPPQKLTEEDFK